jgi:hypothetical protein
MYISGRSLFVSLRVIKAGSKRDRATSREALQV